jgi:hypothetical protein
VTYTRIIGIDPSGRTKPVAAAVWAQGKWMVRSFPSAAALFNNASSLMPSLDEKVLCVVEGGFMSVNAKAAMALQLQRGELLAYMRVLGVPVVFVTPQTWRPALLPAGKENRGPKAERLAAETITGLTGLTADECAAVLIAQWGVSMQNLDIDMEITK